jgi:hypothetical protein
MKSAVNLGFTSTNTACSPTNNMVFKYALVKLVEKVLSEAQEYITVEKASQKGLFGQRP